MNPKTLTLAAIAVASAVAVATLTNHRVAPMGRVCVYLPSDGGDCFRADGGTLPPKFVVPDFATSGKGCVPSPCFQDDDAEPLR